MTPSGQRIMIQMADHAWVEEAVHRACLLARKGGGEIVLVKMVPVQHLSWLGTPFGNWNLTEQDRKDIESCQINAEDYGVTCAGLVFQYFKLPEAIVDAAEYLDADIVFATLPKSLIPFWTQFQLHQLRQQLTRQHRVLFDRRSVLEDCVPANSIRQPL
jgi:hypothetical protein